MSDIIRKLNAEFRAPSENRKVKGMSWGGITGDDAGVSHGWKNPDIEQVRNYCSGTRSAMVVTGSRKWYRKCESETVTPGCPPQSGVLWCKTHILQNPPYGMV